MKIWKSKPIVKALASLAFIVFLGGSVIFLAKDAPPEEMEVKRIEEALMEDGQSVLAVSADEKEAVFESAVFEAQMRFNAIALHWKEKNVTDDASRQVFLRTSLDGKEWEDWMEIESLGPLRDDESRSDRVLPEVPLLVDGNFFQFKVVMKRDGPNGASPRLTDLRAAYFDSRASLRQRLIEKIKEIFSVEAATPGPKIISRAQWGSPDPYGDRFKGTYRYWPPEYFPVKQIFVHHTVFNNTSDPAAAVRAIWAYHAYTRGWGDIGYNYLIDRKGRIYEGRFGGDNVAGGQARTLNYGSLGVALLGCFETTSVACQGAPPPSAAMINGLTTLLAWKATSYGINPNARHTFCGTKKCLRIRTIAGHRDVNPTACPGNLIDDRLPTIRIKTAARKGSWSYSAKQLTLSPVKLLSYGVDQTVTLSFKNTGTATWSNTANRLLLKTANPNGRVSQFQGTGWLNAQTPAALNESSVAPGGTGTFTFNLKGPSPLRGDYAETFRLSPENGPQIPAMFTLVVQLPVDNLTDVAAFYDLGDCRTKIDAFISNGSRFIRGKNGWWSSDTYCASSIAQTVAGDFDGDGASDIAAFADYGNSETRVHVFKSTGSGFADPNLEGWWADSDYDVSKIKHALSGDFNRDKKSDIAAFYENAADQTQIHVWLSKGSSFEYQGPSGWWSGDNYSPTKITGVAAGDFNRDGRSDLAAFYNYGGGAARIHVWLSNGSAFQYQGNGGWWGVDKGYNLSKISGTVSGYFNGDRNGDLATFYDYGSGKTRIHVWLSSGFSFRYQGPKGWWRTDKGYSLSRVPFAVAGFFSPVYEMILGDLVAVRVYPNDETRIHTFLSSGKSFKRQAVKGWWRSTNYNTAGIKKFVSGYFGR